MSINDRGIALDMTLVENAIQMDTQSRNELTSAIHRLTALDNPHSVQQMNPVELVYIMYVRFQRIQITGILVVTGSPSFPFSGIQRCISRSGASIGLP